MLVVSAALSAAGLYAVGHSTGGMLFVTATVFALGVCFFWPTMLGYVSENFPRTGALGLAITGGAGMLSVSFVLPVMGRFYDLGIAARIPADQTVTTLAAAPAGGDLGQLWLKIQAQAGLATLGRVAVLPVILTGVFLALWFFRRPRRVSAAT
jgi:MFS family permease